ncbi:hypothetical protein D3C75_993690 [compost metagenome]
MIKLHQLHGLEIGDTVQLKSGGPNMMIVDFLGCDANVCYPDVNCKFGVLYTFFPMACLKKI